MSSQLRSAHVQSLKELMGMMVFGTFRVVSGVEAQKRPWASQVDVLVQAVRVSVEEMNAFKNSAWWKG